MLCIFLNTFQAVFYYWVISMLGDVSTVMGELIIPVMHAQPCKRTKDEHGLWWAHDKEDDSCQWWGDFRCAVCGRPGHSHYDWVEYSWSWIPDQQPRCRHLYDMIGSDTAFEGVFAIKRGAGGSEEQCYMREGCAMKGTWTSGNSIGCEGLGCINGYGVPRCHCRESRTRNQFYGQRCEHRKDDNDVISYAEGLQVFVNPLVRVLEEITIFISVDYEGTGFFIEINTELDNDVKWINTPTFKRKDDFVTECQTLTNLYDACKLVDGANAIYTAKLKYPVIRYLGEVHFYRTSVSPSIDYPIGYEQRIQVKAYNSAHHGKYVQDKTSAKQIFQTDVIVFVEYPVEIHCNQDVDIERSCRIAQANVKPYRPSRLIKFYGQVTNSYIQEFKVFYYNLNDKLLCIPNQRTSTKWVLWKILPNGAQWVVNEQQSYNNFIFNIEPYMLEKGLYKVQFTYSMFTNYDIRENFATCTLNVYELGLKAVIDGGYKRYVDVETVILIDGSQSEDPNFNDYRSKSGLKFEWGCIDVNDQGKPCLLEKLAAVRKSPREDIIKLARFTFKSGQIYKITLKLSKTDRTTVNTYQLLSTGTGIVSSVSISCISCFTHPIKGPIANPEEVIYLELHVTYKKKYKHNKIHDNFIWFFSEHETNEWKEASSIRIQGSNSYIFKIKENTLKKDKTYHFLAEVPDKYKTEIMFYTSTTGTIECDVEPTSGVRGITLFNAACNYTSSEEDEYIFEFFDKAATDVNYFDGRMLGSGRELTSFRLTNGEFTVYTFTKNKVYTHWKTTIQLFPFNETTLYISDRFDNVSRLLEQQRFGEVMVESTLLSDVLIPGMHRQVEVQKLISYLNQVRIFDTADMKLCLSSLYYVLKYTVNHQKALDFEPVLDKHVSDVLLRVSGQLSKSLHRKDDEYTLMSSIVDHIYEPIIDISGMVLFHTRPMKPVELINPKIIDTVQKATDNAIQALEYLSDYLLNRQVVDDDGKEIKSKHMTAWVKVNTFNVWLNETKTNRTPSIDLPKTSVNLTSTTTEVIGIQITHMKKSPFWWSKINIVTEVLLVEVCNRINDSLCENIFITRDPFHIEYDINQSVRSLKLLNGTTGDVHPYLSPSDMDLAITVYRFDPPFKSKMFIELICDTSSTVELKVLIMRNLRPDYRIINEEGIVLSCKTSIKLLSYMKNDKDEFFYMGVIPNEPNITSTKLEFKFLVFYTICYYWEVWQWGTFNCGVGDKTDKSILQCDCTHLSTFAGSVAVPPTLLDPAKIFPMLPLKETHWILPLILLLVIVFVYFILLVWAWWKDKKDLIAKDVIVLKDNYPGDKYAFLIGVFTGSRLNSSCNANVGVKLFGEQNQSRAHILKSDEQEVFKGNSDNWFLLYCPQPLGILETLQLWHDNTGTSPDWFVETIVVVDLIDKIEYFFELNVWIALEVDEYPEVYVSPSSVQEYFSVKGVFLNNLVTGLRDTHYWTSILWKHPRNPVTRVQRVSVVLVFIMVALLISLVLFYITFKVSDIPEDIPSFEITGIDWCILLASLVVSSVTACLVMFLFRKSFSHDYKRRSRRSSVFLRPSETDSRVSFVPSLTTSELERDYINVSRSLWDDKYIRYGIRSQPKHERTTFQNFGVAVYSILRGSPLEQIKLPKYKSTLRVKKIVLTVAWLLIVLIIVSTVVTVFSLGVQLPPIVGEKWVTMFVLTVLFDVLVFSTVKILLFSSVLSFMFLRFLPSPNYNVRPRDGMAKHLVGNADYLHYLADIRSQPMYCPLSDNMKRTHREKRINIMNWKLLLDFVVLIVCIVILVMLNDSSIQNHYYVNSQAEIVVTKGHDVQYPNFQGVFNKSMFEQFLRYNLYPQLYKFLWYNMEDPLEPHFYSARRQSWTNDCVLKLLGNGRIRQVRVQLGTCSEVRFVGDMRALCAPSWSPSIEDQDIYSVGWKVARYADLHRKSAAWKYTDPKDSGSNRITGNTLTTYHEGGYIIEISYIKEVTLDAITELVTKNWLDHMTRAVFVEMTLLNANTGLLSQVILASEQMATGQYLQRVQVDSFPIEMGVSVWNICFVICLVFFFLKMCVLMNRKGLFVYLSTAINVYEVFLVALGFTTVTLYFVYKQIFSSYIKKFQRSGIDAFFSFSDMISYITWSNTLMAFLFPFLVVRSLISWRFGRTFYRFFYTFVLSLSWIVWLILYFNILFIVSWRLIGYLLDTYIFSYYTTFLIYSNEYPYFASNLKHYQILVYAMCFLSYLNILIFIASFLYYYRVAKVHKLINTDTLNFCTFLYGKIKKKLKKNKTSRGGDET